MFGQIERAREVRELVSEAYQESRRAWAGLLSRIDAAAEPHLAFAVGSFHQALLSGVLAQWLVDPDHAPSASDLTEALRTVASQVAGQP